jgi:hypothetical protein
MSVYVTPRLLHAYAMTMAVDCDRWSVVQIEEAVIGMLGIQ